MKKAGVSCDDIEMAQRGFFLAFYTHAKTQHTTGKAVLEAKQFAEGLFRPAAE